MNVTVIIPFHNEIDLIHRALSSVARQTIFRSHQWQIIICNDGDFLCSEILTKVPVQLLSMTEIHKNTFARGPGNARNVGLKNAKYNLVAFLDADDAWSEQKLELQLEKIDMGYNFVCSSYGFFNKNIIITPQKEFHTVFDVVNGRIGTSTALLNTADFSNIFFKNEKFSQDTLFWADLASTGLLRGFGVQNTLCKNGTSGRTRNKFIQLLHFVKIVGKMQISMFVKLKLMIFYCVRGIYRHWILPGLSGLIQHKH